MKLFFSFIWVIILLSCAQPEEKWEEIIASEHTTAQPRHECGLVSSNNKLYIIGGRGLKPIDIYDSNTNLWTKGAQPPIEIHHFQPVVYNGYIIIVGAFTGEYPNEDPVSNILIYHPLEDNWYVGDSIPIHRRRGSGGTVVLNQKIYWVGGLTNGHVGGHVSYFDEYDPINKTWKELPETLQARDHFQAVIYNDKVYLAGGRRSKAPFGTFSSLVPEIEFYDFETKSWDYLALDLPTPRAGTMSLVINDLMLVGGGESTNREYAHEEIEAFDFIAQKWVNLPKMINGRHGTGMVTQEGKVITVGGSFKRGGGPELSDLISLNMGN